MKKKSITLNVIYLKTLENKKGEHEYTHLQTGKVIIYYNMKYVTITDLVIKYVEVMAYVKGITILKIQEKNRVPLNPVDWISK